MLNLGLWIGLSIGQFQYVQLDPSREVRTIATPDFRIHFQEELRPEAEHLSHQIEVIAERIESKMRWKPAGPVHVVLTSSPDEANGLATPIPTNSIFLTLAAPAEGTNLDHYDDWLTLLFSHEYTHTVHIDMVGGWGRLLRGIFGRTWVPNAIQPQWLIEGLAMYNETTETTAGRGRSPFVDMYLRTASLEDRFLDIEDASYWHDDYPYGNAAYWYGVHFHFFLARQISEKSLIDFAHKNARWLIPSFLNFKTADVFGKSFDRLWNEWKQEEKRKAETLRAAHRPQKTPRFLMEPDWILNSRPAWDAKSQTLYAVIGRNLRNRLVSLTRSSDGSWKEKTLETDFSGSRLQAHEGKLYFHRGAASGPYESRSDLFEYDLKTRKTKKLTEGWNIRETLVSGKKVFAVKRMGLRHQLIRFDLPLSEAKDFQALREQKFEVLFDPKGFGNIGSLTLSPDGSRLVFGFLKERSFRDLFLLDLSSNQLERLTQDSALDYFPIFEPSGDSLLLTSGRKLGGTDQVVFNVYRLNLASKNLSAVTDTWGGAYWPVPIGNQMIYGDYGPEGFRLAEVSSSSLSGETLKVETLETKIPPILSEARAPEKTKESSYAIGNSLWPRYWVPFWLVSDDDSLAGAITGSNDPLSRHAWTGLVYHFFEPQRPGGALSYQYSGLSSVNLFASGGASLENQGQLMVASASPAPGLRYHPDDYYERTYSGRIGLRYRPAYKGFWSRTQFSHFLFVEDRRPATDVPSSVFRSLSELQAYGYPTAKGLVFPESGQRFGLGTNFVYSSGLSKDLDGISPYAGRSITTGLLYSPQIWISDFQTLMTTASYLEYLELWPWLSLAWDLRAGIQWLDVLYQKTFRMGGTLGLSRFGDLGTNSYPLRGLPSGYFRGEGVSTLSLEARFPLLKNLPGFGTAPLWIKNLHGALFTDVGQIFQQQDTHNFLDSLTVRESLRPRDFSFSRFSQSFGAELRTDTGLYYGPPLTWRLGYARMNTLAGKSVWGQKIDEIYFLGGPSF